MVMLEILLTVFSVIVLGLMIVLPILGILIFLYFMFLPAEDIVISPSRQTDDIDIPEHEGYWREY